MAMRTVGVGIDGPFLRCPWRMLHLLAFYFWLMWSVRGTHEARFKNSSFLSGTVALHLWRQKRPSNSGKAAGNHSLQVFYCHDLFLHVIVNSYRIPGWTSGRNFWEKKVFAGCGIPQALGVVVIHGSTVSISGSGYGWFVTPTARQSVSGLSVKTNFPKSTFRTSWCELYVLIIGTLLDS